jgi:hypothetical protein
MLTELSDSIHDFVGAYEEDLLPQEASQEPLNTPEEAALAEEKAAANGE